MLVHTSVLSVWAAEEEDHHKFKSSLVYIAHSRSAKAT